MPQKFKFLIQNSSYEAQGVDSFTQENSRRFRALCVRYSELSHQAGVDVRPCGEGTNERFKTLTIAQQLGIINHIEQSIDLCESSLRSGISIRSNSLSFVWQGLRKAGLRPLSHVFSDLEDGDLIELYDAHDRQFFRTFNMFECLSYSLEEIFTYEWFELFERDQSITEQIREATQAILTGAIRTTAMINGPVHLIEEKFSPRRKQAHIQTKLLSPLFTEDGRTGGYVSCSRLVKLVERPLVASWRAEVVSPRVAQLVPLRRDSVDE